MECGSLGGGGERRGARTTGAFLSFFPILHFFLYSSRGTPACKNSEHATPCFKPMLPFDIVLFLFHILHLTCHTLPCLFPCLPLTPQKRSLQVHYAMSGARPGARGSFVAVEIACTELPARHCFPLFVDPLMLFFDMIPTENVSVRIDNMHRNAFSLLNS